MTFNLIVIIALSFLIGFDVATIIGLHMLRKVRTRHHQELDLVSKALDKILEEHAPDPRGVKSPIQITKLS